MRRSAPTASVVPMQVVFRQHVNAGAASAEALAARMAPTTAVCSKSGSVMFGFGGDRRRASYRGTSLAVLVQVCIHDGYGHGSRAVVILIIGQRTREPRGLTSLVSHRMRRPSLTLISAIHVYRACAATLLLARNGGAGWVGGRGSRREERNTYETTDSASQFRHWPPWRQNLSSRISKHETTSRTATPSYDVLPRPNSTPILL